MHFQVCFIVNSAFFLFLFFGDAQMQKPRSLFVLTFKLQHGEALLKFIIYAKEYSFNGFPRADFKHLGLF